MRYRNLTLCLCLGLALTGQAFAPALAGQDLAPPVSLKRAVVLEDAVLRLGDLFEGLGADADRAIARAPAPGRRAELDARWLAAVADGYGVAWQPDSALDSVVVTRASQTIGGQRIADALMDALAARGLSGDVEIALDNPALALHLPLDAEPSLALGALRYDPASGRFSAALAAPAGPAPQARATVTGQAVAMTEVPVLSRRMAPGEVIGPAELDWLRLRADRLAGNVVLDPANIVGMSPRRAIRPGQAIRAGDLRTPVLVPRNSLVVIRLETERMVLTAQGRALEDGATGQVIRVMNTKSNTIINGVVAGPGKVRVVQAGTVAAGDTWARY